MSATKPIKKYTIKLMLLFDAEVCSSDGKVTVSSPSVGDTVVVDTVVVDIVVEVFSGGDANVWVEGPDLIGIRVIIGRGIIFFLAHFF